MDAVASLLIHQQQLLQQDPFLYLPIFVDNFESFENVEPIYNYFLHVIGHMDDHGKAELEARSKTNDILKRVKEDHPANAVRVLEMQLQEKLQNLHAMAEEKKTARPTGKHNPAKKQFNNRMTDLVMDIQILEERKHAALVYAQQWKDNKILNAPWVKERLQKDKDFEKRLLAAWETMLFLTEDVDEGVHDDHFCKVVKNNQALEVAKSYLKQLYKFK